MRGWYNIHDHANNRFGFVPYRGSQKSPAIRAYTTPRTKLSYNTHDFDGFVTYQHGSGSRIAMIVIFTLAGIGGVAILVWQLTKKSSGVQSQEQVKSKKAVKNLTSDEISDLLQNLKSN